MAAMRGSSQSRTVTATSPGRLALLARKLLARCGPGRAHGDLTERTAKISGSGFMETESCSKTVSTSDRTGARITGKSLDGLNDSRTRSLCAKQPEKAVVTQEPRNGLLCPGFADASQGLGCTSPGLGPSLCAPRCHSRSETGSASESAQRSPASLKSFGSSAPGCGERLAESAESLARRSSSGGGSRTLSGDWNPGGGGESMAAHALGSDSAPPPAPNVTVACCSWLSSTSSWDWDAPLSPGWASGSDGAQSPVFVEEHTRCLLPWEAKREISKRPDSDSPSLWKPWRTHWGSKDPVLGPRQTESAQVIPTANRLSTRAKSTTQDDCEPLRPLEERFKRNAWPELSLAQHSWPWSLLSVRRKQSTCQHLSNEHEMRQENEDKGGGGLKSSEPQTPASDCESHSNHCHIKTATAKEQLFCVPLDESRSESGVLTTRLQRSWSMRQACDLGSIEPGKSTTKLQDVETDKTVKTIITNETEKALKDTTARKRSLPLQHELIINKQYNLRKVSNEPQTLLKESFNTPWLPSAVFPEQGKVSKSTCLSESGTNRQRKFIARSQRAQIRPLQHLPSDDGADSKSPGYEVQGSPVSTIPCSPTFSQNSSITYHTPKEPMDKTLDQVMTGNCSSISPEPNTPGGTSKFEKARNKTPKGLLTRIRPKSLNFTGSSFGLQKDLSVHNSGHTLPGSTKHSLFFGDPWLPRVNHDDISQTLSPTETPSLPCRLSKSNSQRRVSLESRPMELRSTQLSMPTQSTPSTACKENDEENCAGTLVWVLPSKDVCGPPSMNERNTSVQVCGVTISNSTSACNESDVQIPQKCQAPRCSHSTSSSPSPVPCSSFSFPDTPCLSPSSDLSTPELCHSTSIINPTYPKEGQEDALRHVPLHHRRRPVSAMVLPALPSPRSPESKRWPRIPLADRVRPLVVSKSTPTGLNHMGRRRRQHTNGEGWTNGKEGLGGLGAVPGASSSDDDDYSEDSSDSRSCLGPLTGSREQHTITKLLTTGCAVYAEALWDHVTMNASELGLRAGQLVRVHGVTYPQWWFGAIGETRGWFPANFVRLCVNQEELSEDGDQADGVDGNEVKRGVEGDNDPAVAIDHGYRMGFSTNNWKQKRANVIEEILRTERDYIQNLKNICQGYIKQCQNRPDMFSTEQLATIFSNIEEIYHFQQGFLEELEAGYDVQHSHLSLFGSCFLNNCDRFKIYSEYCNNHPDACAEVSHLSKNKSYGLFLEQCRLRQDMISINLNGFLLHPVQKICKYPLQLKELLKCTPPDHSDHKLVASALAAMSNVANLINERKRRMENVEKIARWQAEVCNWEGEDILVRSSERIHSGDVTIVPQPNGRPQPRYAILFDHQLILCKKDLIRRDVLYYKSRVVMDDFVVEEVTDISIKPSLLLRCKGPVEASLLLCTRQPEDHKCWMEAFTKERKRVCDDLDSGFVITEIQKQQAIIAIGKAKSHRKCKAQVLDKTSGAPYQPVSVCSTYTDIPSSVPQQQVFVLAEPRRKPWPRSTFLQGIGRLAPFRK
uniref:Rho guanine nucleotide exchange factor 4 n=1 Tax=Eptatretus burgeri TaxID=7764 RepID=A0A8C4QD42_EPTBU